MNYLIYLLMFVMLMRLSILSPTTPPTGEGWGYVGFCSHLLINFGPRGGAFELCSYTEEYGVVGGGVVSQDAWEKIGRAVGAKTVLVTVGDHDRIVAFERFD